MKVEEKIKELYQNGKSPYQIAKELQISIQEIRNDLRAMNKRGEIEENNYDKKNSPTTEKITNTKLQIKQKMEERRQQVKELYLEEKDPIEIATTLRFSIATIYDDIRALKEKGELPNQSRRQIEREDKRKIRSQEIQKLCLQGKTQEKIASIMQISISTVHNDIQRLIKEGKLLESDLVSGKVEQAQKKEKRRQEIQRLRMNGVPQEEIPSIMNISVSTVYRHVQILKNEGKLPDSNLTGKRFKQSQEKERRRQEIQKLYMEGKTQKEIMSTMGISQSKVSDDILKLKMEGKIPKLSIKQIQQKERVEARRKRVKEMFLEKKSTIEIAEALNEPIGKIYSDIERLKIEGELPKLSDRRVEKQEEIAARRKEVQRLYELGKKQSEIAEILKVSRVTISYDLKQLREQGEIENKERINSNVSKEENKCIMNEYKKALKEGFLGKDDLEKIKEIMNVTNSYKDIIIYANACIHFQEFQEAINTLNYYIMDNGGSFTRRTKK